MLANLKHNVSLWLTEKTGFTTAFFAFGGAALGAALMGFIFLCVSGYAWAAAELGPVFGGLVSAGVFMAIAACSLAVAASSRSQARKRATFERAHRTQGASVLINPKTLQLVMQARPPYRLAEAHCCHAARLSRNPVRSRTKASRE
jgi:hypothetical protein